MRTEVLDHGYIELVEVWGHGRGGSGLASFNDDDYEVGIVEAARQSTQGNFRGWETDAKLLEFLYKNKHATPFEFAGMVIEVQAPIFVLREWHRHRTQSYNEMSARYTPLPDLYYVPDVDRVMLDGGKNRQAQGTGRELISVNAELFRERLENFYRIAESHYQNALADGIPKELARCVMPVGHYTRMRASANLRNWLAFLTLRMDPLAQWEIRQFANAVGKVIEQNFPRTWQLFHA